MDNLRSIKVYSFFLLLLFVTSMGCWIGWGNKTLLQSIIGFLLVITSSVGCVKFDFSRQNIVKCVLFYFPFLIVNLGWSTQVLFTQLPSYLIPIICVVCLHSNDKVLALTYITKYYSYLMIPSLFLYFASLAGFSFSLGTITPGVGDYGNYENLIFYIRQVRDIFPRFNGPFMEPGHLGMMGAFLLMANTFDLKRLECKIILFSVIVSFSLAGYMLVFIGFMMSRYSEEKLSINSLILYISIGTFVILLGQNYNGGDNAFNNQILSRLELDDQRGISGNNRTNLFVMKMFMEMWSDYSVLLFGYSPQELMLAEDHLQYSNGIQLFMVRHGLLSVILSLSYYMITIKYSSNKKYARLFFMFVIFCFVQRTYTYWFAWIICYEYGICIQDINYNKSEEETIEII